MYQLLLLLYLHCWSLTNLRPSSGADLFMSQTQHIPVTLNLRTQRHWSLIQKGMAILSFILSERLKNQVHSKQETPKLTWSFSKLRKWGYKILSKLILMDETGVKLLLLLCRYNEQLMTSSCKKTNLVMSYKLTLSVCCKLDSWSLYFISCLYCRSTALVQSSLRGKVVSILEEQNALTSTCLHDDTGYMLYWVIINKIYLYSFSANQVTLALCITLIWHLENLSWSPALQTRIHSLNSAFSLWARSPKPSKASLVRPRERGAHTFSQTSFHSPK